MQSAAFLIKPENLTEVLHARCVKKCKITTEHMLKCTNVKFGTETNRPCSSFTHLSCAELKLGVAMLLDRFYCETCMRADNTGGLENIFKESVESAAKLAELISNETLRETKENLNKALEELQETTDSLHARNVAIQERDTKIVNLEQENKSLKEIVFDSGSADTMHDLFKRARTERESMGGFAGATTSTALKKNPKKILFSSAYNLKDVTLAAMAMMYPNYEEQEKEADKLTPENLETLRKNIATQVPFDGDVASWATFKTSFIASSRRGHYREVEDVERLRKLIKGDALEMFGPELSSPFASAIDILEKLDHFYGLDANAVRHQLEVISKLPKISRKFDKEKIMSLLKAVKSYAILCKQFSQEAELKAESSLYAIESKMSTDHVPHWRKWVAKNNHAISVEGISEYLEDLLRQIVEKPSLDAQKPYVMKTEPSVLPASSSGSSSSIHSQARGRRNENRQKKPPSCFNCKNEHSFYKCPQVSRATHDERMAIVKRLKVCENCLTSNRHDTLRCNRVTMKCPIESCTISRKHPLLHGHKNEMIKSFIFMQHQLTINSSIPSTFYKILSGQVVCAKGELLPITLMIDSGAGVSLAEMSLLKRGGWNFSPLEISMRWTKNIVRTEANAAKFDVDFIPNNCKYKYKISGLIAVENLELPEQEQRALDIKNEFSYLSHVPLPSFDKQKPQILLGLPHNRLICTIQSIKGEGPIAELCELGWTIGGTATESLNVELITDPIAVSSHCTISPPSVDECIDPLLELVKFHFSFESIGIKSQKSSGTSLDDKRAEEILERTLKFHSNLKRYEASYLWAQDDFIMPNNYEMAKSRLIHAEQRLKKLGIENQLIEQFNNDIESGQIVKITTDELEGKNRINFLPGFVVFNKNKVPIKVRWVHDPAATFRGKSLNKMLLKGPDNLLEMPKAICALREQKVAFTADVKSMFNQILMNEDDQFAQLSLWRNCDQTKEPEIYKQTRLIFGPKCSPTIANAVRLKHAKLSSNKFPKASDVAIHQMYMDDVLDSRESIEEAVKVSKQLIEMFDEISWPLIQFQSNCKEFLESLPPSRVSDKMVELCSGDDIDLTTKVLGIFWKPSTDTFIFKLNDDALLKKCFNGYIPCRKEVLSLVMRLFDIMGYIAHFHVRGRLILQELCRRAMSWKDKIPSDLIEKWNKWLSEFKQIDKLEIPRQYISKSINDCEISFHMFGDASTEAYAAMVFIRFDFGYEVHVRLMAAKARVAPIKYNSVPRLELMAAVIGTRLLEATLKWQRRIKPSFYLCWSDSHTVLRWLFAKHIRHTQFVAPRVSEIQEKTSLLSWKFVPTSENVADLGTKWINIEFNDPTQKWFHGPEFLYQPRELWPTQAEDLSTPCVSENLIKVKKGIPLEHVMLTKPCGVINPWQVGIIEGVSASTRSDWLKLTRVTAIALRVFKPKVKKQTRNTIRFVEPKELKEAEYYIIRKVQREVFKNEWERLSNGKQVGTSSKIFSLSPFFCTETNLIRIKTRLSGNFPYDMRFPPILPNLHEVSDAIIRFHHNSHGHVGDNAIMGSIRAFVWIASLRKAVRRCRRRCLHCIEQGMKPIVPERAPLPEFRQDHEELSFYYTGVDCFGPIETYVGRSLHKKSVWVIIFTCLITRAVYMEVLDDMTTESVLCAFEKLWARRGPVAHMYSDNGRNFLGLANFLDADDKLRENVEKRFNELKIKWHFQPPYTPHFGGAWERLIKDVKRSLESSFGKFTVRRIALETALVQIEGHMNDRPLTEFAVTPDDLEPITPNLLMKGHSNHPLVRFGKWGRSDETELERKFQLVSKQFIKNSKHLVKTYMKRWLHEVLPDIARHPAGRSLSSGLKLGDYVISIDPSKTPREWKRGIISEVYTGRDGRVRVADVKTSSGEILTRRSAARLAKLDIRFDHPEAEQSKYNISVEENSKCNSPRVNLHFAPSTEKQTITNAFNFFTHEIVKINQSKETMASEIIAKQKKDLTSLKKFEGSYGSKELEEKYLDKDLKRTVYVKNIPSKAGIAQIFQLADIFGTAIVFNVRRWSLNKPFSAFITFEKQESVYEAIAMSNSITIGCPSTLTYNRITFEFPNKCRRDFCGASKSWIELGAFKQRVLVVRCSIENSAQQPIPISTNERLIFRDCDTSYEYEFNSISVKVKKLNDFATVELPCKLRTRPDTEAAEDIPERIFEKPYEKNSSNDGLAKRVVIRTPSAIENQEEILDIDDVPELEEEPEVKMRPMRPNQIVDNEAKKKKLKSVIIKVRCDKAGRRKVFRR